MASFSPILGHAPKVLILGSMPSRRSLVEQQYYAHPQNAFWWLMGEILAMPAGLNYSARVDELKAAGIAVWDVLYDCERPGSLDSRIVRASEKANDVPGLLSNSPTIKLLAFNGGAANAIFKRHCQLTSTDVQTVQLPSTSPAYAALRKADKLSVWRNALSPFIRPSN